MDLMHSIAELFLKFFDVFLHLDKYLGSLIQSYGSWTYIIIFGVIFAETGLVITPFLPGDSLLFAIGTFAGLGYLDIKVSMLIVFIAAVAGDAATGVSGRN